MRKIRDVLRLSAAGMSNRKIAAGLDVGVTTVGACLRRARAAGVGWPLLDDLSDEALEARLHQGVLLRAGGQSDLCRDGGALRHRRRAGAAQQAAVCVAPSGQAGAPCCGCDARRVHRRRVV